jgi:uncharacterized membrane protein
MRFYLTAAATALLAACNSQQDVAQTTVANAATPQEPAAAKSHARAPSAKGNSPQTVGACMMQGDVRLDIKPLRATGTEPFWGARIEGRCITYTHPDDQQGTRVWTRYAKGADGETWAGALGGKPFVLRASAKPGCSDGMSDKSYPLAVSLKVQGEDRKGCAEPT